MVQGGYEEGYETCPCFWGEDPSSFVKLLGEYVPSLSGRLVLDAGCGEGKNAAYLASLGVKVIALDISLHALRNGKSAFSHPNIQWGAVDVTSVRMRPDSFDGVVMYGLPHCLESPEHVRELIRTCQRATRSAGFHVVCSFNSGSHDLTEAHPGFRPTLLHHSEFLNAYEGWEIRAATDSILTETHPHNGIEHHHSMTRLIALKP